jgi:MYXO-CTERM domain-containing protein
MRRAVPLLAASLLVVAASAARADVPAGYKGKPFDPAVAGGKGTIPSAVKAGPYAVPGRIDLINYDLGGVGVAYDCQHHEVKGGVGYRVDLPTASLSLTAQSKPDVWYQAGAPLDGMFYPSATTEDFYVGALDAGDWFNYTVDVKTAGTYAVSSTWATGNGPPGGMGGDGTVSIQISVNGTLAVDWKTAFPDYMTTANYHNWKPYPSFATLKLDAGLQVLKVQVTSNHFNLDYLELDLPGADGGVAADAGAGDDGGASDASAATGTAGASGAAGNGTMSGAAGSGTVTGAAGATQPTTGAAGAGGATVTGAAGASTAGTGGSTSGAAGAPGQSATSKGGCAIAATTPAGSAGSWLGLALVALGARTSRRRRSNRR